LGRVIHTESAGKDRNRLTKAIVLALAKLAETGASNEKRRDLAAFICLSLRLISETIDPTVAAWEKRGYWVKADRFRMEWSWTGQAAQKLKEAFLADDWDAIAQLADQIGVKLAKVKVSPHNRLGQPWVGAWEKLRGEIIS
jgi:hypothetical protein